MPVARSSALSTKNWIASLRSPPEQKAFLAGSSGFSAPVTIATHKPSSALKSSQALASWPKAARLRAFRRSGRLMVTKATRTLFS